MNVLTSRIGKRDQNTSIRCEATDQNFNCGCVHKQGYAIMVLSVRLAQVSGFTHRCSALASAQVFIYFVSLASQTQCGSIRTRSVPRPMQILSKNALL